MKKWEICKVSRSPSSSVRVVRLDVPDKKVLDEDLEGMEVDQVIALLESKGWERADPDFISTYVGWGSIDKEKDRVEMLIFKREIQD